VKASHTSGVSVRGAGCHTLHPGCTCANIVFYVCMHVNIYTKYKLKRALI
jgi:hypothetical protein